MRSISHYFTFVLLIVIFTTTSADVSLDVKYLRKQYNIGKNNANNLIVQYNGKQVRNGDVLKKANTQTVPTVQINLETDPEMPYFTLVTYLAFLRFLSHHVSII